MKNKFRTIISSFIEYISELFTQEESEENIVTRAETGFSFDSNINTNSINNSSNYPLEHESFSNNSVSFSSASSAPQNYPKLDDPLIELSQRFLEEARRYPMDFKREESF